MDPTFELPFFAKTAMFFISLFAFVYILYIGEGIIIPIVYAIIIAILLNPLVNYLISHKVNKIIAIFIAVVLTIFAVMVIIYIVSAQFSMISEIYPKLKEKFNATSTELLHWISRRFSIPQAKINASIADVEKEAVNNLALVEKITAAGRMMMVGILLPVYTFMILYYKPLLLAFIHQLFAAKHQAVLNDVLMGTKKIIQSYLVGLFFEMLIIGTLNSIGLLILGINYAIILGITGAVLNVIPYIGGIIAIALPMLIAFVTKDSSTYTFLVLGVYMFIQFVDNHYVIPRIVASRVQINALISVIVVLIGGALWGIPGMFLSIPLTAIAKVIFDHIEPLKPWGFLLGNIVPTASRFSFIPKKKVR